MSGMTWSKRGRWGIGSSKWPDVTLIPDIRLIGYNAKGRGIYTKFGVYTPWCLILVGERWYRDLHSKVKVNMDGGWSKGENTEFVCKTLGLKSRSKWKDFYTRNVAFEWTRTTMKPWSSSMNVNWWGEVSNEMEGGRREVSHAPCCNLMKMNTLSIDRLCFGKYS